MKIERHGRPESRAFTLVELLVVIGIIAVLISILLPSLARARGAALALQCSSNMRQLGQGIAMYQNDFQGAFPSTHFYKGYNNGSNSTPGYRAEIWDVKIVPYLGVNVIMDPNNWLDAQGTPSVPFLMCPADKRIDAYSWGPKVRSYAGNGCVPLFNAAGAQINGGPNGSCANDGVIVPAQPHNIGYPGNVVKTGMVKRPSETALLFEYWYASATDGNRQFRVNFASASGWLGPADPIITDSQYNFMYHNQKMNVLWCDGHVTLEDPRDAYQPTVLGKRSWWTRNNNIN